MTNVGFRIFARATPPDDGVVRKLAAFRTTDLSDGLRRSATMAGIAAIYPGIRAVAGPAVTVSVPVGGFNMIKMALARCEPGDVLVIAARGNTVNALWGGNLSLGAKRSGLAGVIVDGAVRDVREIQELDFPVFAAAIATSADGLDIPYGEINVPVACGRIVVNPGDVVIADEDGVVCIRPEDASAVLEATKRVVSGHAALRPVLERGDVTSRAEIEESLLRGGLTVVDEKWR
jgi:regulator of RNase E activity RraA